MLGMSVDFAEHRAYMPGDDVRRIDWRLFARTDRLYVKEFEADTNANLHLLLDVSRSMDYGSGSVTKLEYAKFLAASLAYLSRRQRDRIGLITFDNRSSRRFRRRSSISTRCCMRSTASAPAAPAITTNRSQR